MAAAPLVRHQVRYPSWLCWKFAALVPAAMAQQGAPEEVIVTARKRG